MTVCVARLVSGRSRTRSRSWTLTLVLSPDGATHSQNLPGKGLPQPVSILSQVGPFLSKLLITFIK